MPAKFRTVAGAVCLLGSVLACSSTVSSSADGGMPGADAASSGGSSGANTGGSIGSGGSGTSGGSGGTTASGGRPNGAGGKSSGGSSGSGGKASTGGTGGASTGGSGGSKGGPPPSRPVAITCDAPSTPAPAPAWKNVTANLANMPSECGNLTLIEADPCSKQVIAGVAKVGLYATTNGGTSWTKLGTGAGSAAIVHRPSSIVFDPEHPAVFWESGIYGSGADGIYKTTDGGTTFTQLGNVGHNDLVSVDFTDPERKTLLAGSHERTQTLYRSRDGGANWTNIGAKLPPNSHFSILPLVLGPQHFLLGSCGYGDGECGVYASGDGGETWTRNTTESPAARPLWATNGALYWSTIYDSGGIWSADVGKSWTKVGGPRTVYPVELPNGKIVSAGNDHLILSSDGGKTWSNIGETLPFKPSSITYSRATKTFFISQWDCGDIVLPNAIWSAGYDYA
jgi:hypothetical protein